MFGLTMMKLYLDEILSGQKTNDTRLYPTEKRGTIALVDSSSFKAYGLAELVSVREIAYEEFVSWHQTGPFAGVPIAPYHKGKKCYSYELSGVRRLTIPVQLPKDPDARVWIDITDEKAKSFSYQTTLFRVGRAIGFPHIMRGRTLSSMGSIESGCSGR